ncbi:hypothetical protein E2C01_016718 [Portunus trituberculatus]|uniref:Uncharacterized protein n=1 Tax=Portunus trituberculatus TaxID=210409 RepID=A0A5B7DRF0_PORTR|nr:hypothetical protein [Portunus trituberculatus]
MRRSQHPQPKPLLPTSRRVVVAMDKQIQYLGVTLPLINVFKNYVVQHSEILNRIMEKVPASPTARAAYASHPTVCGE